jgi:hypothetical protein
MAQANTARIDGDSFQARHFWRKACVLLDANSPLVPYHSDYDWLIPSQFRMGRSSGATRIWMLRARPG